MIGPANLLVQGLPEVAVYLPEPSELKDKSSSRNSDLTQLEAFEFLRLAEPPYYDLQDYLHLLVVDYLQNLLRS